MVDGNNLVNPSFIFGFKNYTSGTWWNIILYYSSIVFRKVKVEWSKVEDIKENWTVVLPRRTWLVGFYKLMNYLKIGHLPHCYRGQFVLLIHCYYDCHKHTGRVYMSYLQLHFIIFHLHFVLLFNVVFPQGDLQWYAYFGTNV